MADDSGQDFGMPDYLEQSLRSIHKVNALVKGKGGTLEINMNLCRNIINYELQIMHDFLMHFWERLLVKDKVDDRRRVAMLQLYAVVKQAENLVQQCCESNDSTWPERALSLRAIKEDVLDIVLHLRWWTTILQIAIDSATSKQSSISPSLRHMEIKRLERANQDFEEMLNVMAVFDIMDSFSNESKRKGSVKGRMGTIKRIVEQHGTSYTGELGTKEHLKFVLSFDYSESDGLRTSTGGIKFQRLDGGKFRNVLMRCIELQNAAYRDKNHLVNKALDVTASYTGASGSREHCAYLLANQVFSLLTHAKVDEIPELNEYKVEHTVGQGAFGVVNRVTWCGVDCVLKQIVNDPSSSGDRSEAKCLKRFSHPHIVRFFRHFVASPGGSEEHSPQSHIVMEKMPMDLAQHIKNLKETSPSSSRSSSSTSSSSVVPFSEPVAVDIMLQLAKALWHMHSKYVVHRDLKPGKVLVKRVSQKELPELYDQGYVQVKLGDFGLVRENKVSSKSQLLPHSPGSSPYRAPELSLPNSTAKKVKADEKDAVSIKQPHRGDVWSFGVMSSEILGGERPFGKDQNMSTLLANIQKNVRPRIPESCPDYLRFCIESCWRYEPLQRPKFADIWRMLRIAKLRSLGLINQNYDWFRYKNRNNQVVGSYTGSVISAQQILSERTSGMTKPAKGNFSFLMSVFLKFKMFGRPKLTPTQGLDIHFVSRHKKPFGSLTNKVWPREKVNDWKLDVIFFEGNVGGRQKLSCRDTWLQRNEPKVFWPRDWLPEDLHNGGVRVLVLEYCISETGLEGLINDIKESLIYSYQWNQEQTWERPICLIGHSVGCTVIEALVLDLEQEAMQLTFEEKGYQIENSKPDLDKTKANISRNFMYSLRGCFFYGYPSYGLVKSHSFLTEVFGGGTYSADLFGAEFWEGSQRLQKRSSEFLGLAKARNPQIRVMSMVEGGHTRDKFVVRRILYPLEYDLTVADNFVLEDSNHVEICKPVDREHPSYTELVKFLITNSYSILLPHPRIPVPEVQQTDSPQCLQL